MFLNLILVFLPFGYLYATIKSKGILRKKASLITIGMFIYSIIAISTVKTFLDFIMSVLRIEYYTYESIQLIILSLAYLIIFIGFKITVPLEILDYQDTDKSLIKTFGLDLSRRAEITEEEVSISKEKKICLVCKSALGRFNIYLCIECGALYCEKCAKALSTLENTCWVCETPFDESKPVKLPEIEEEVPLIEEDTGKK
jgi:hypothetical protein